MSTSSITQEATTITPTSSEPAPVSEQTGKHLEDSLTHLVDNSDAFSGGRHDELAASEVQADAVHSHGPKAKGWISRFFPSAETVDKLFSYENMGNYVIDRQTGRKNFESMPLYVRVGMHLLFVEGVSYMSTSSIQKLLESQSVKQGEIYDKQGPDVREHIQSFIDAYNLPLNELLVQDLDQYPTFNSFFSRRLNPQARPITSPTDPRIITSAADCRLTAFQTVDNAKRIWIKGKRFTIQALLNGEGANPADNYKAIVEDPACSLAIFRLAPQDYHRFHSPVEGEVVDISDIKGELYTVNPQAINEDLNVYTLNKRSIMIINANFGPGRPSVPIAFVAIGAMLVGSIGWSKKPGDQVVKGEELGWFQYGGSTVITVFPSATGIRFDEDLLNNSEKMMETLVQVGMEIGKVE